MTNGKNPPSATEKAILWAVAPVVLAGVALGTYCVLRACCSDLLSEQPVGMGDGLQIASIVYAAVGGFIAVMIPIHYSISLDILGKLKERDKASGDADDAKHKLLHYCHTAEVIIYCFGLFGVSVLFQETYVVCSLFKIHLPWWFVPGTTAAYALLVVVGIVLNLIYRHDWHVIKSRHGAFYYINVGLVLLLSGVWTGLLFASQCGKLNAVWALSIVTTYYLLWLLLRAEYAPMTDVRAVLGIDQ